MNPIMPAIQTENPRMVNTRPAQYAGVASKTWRVAELGLLSQGKAGKESSTTLTPESMITGPTIFQKIIPKEIVITLPIRNILCLKAKFKCQLISTNKACRITNT